MVCGNEKEGGGRGEITDMEEDSLDVYSPDNGTLAVQLFVTRTWMMSLFFQS